MKHSYQGKQIFIRPIHVTDAAQIAKYANDKAVAKYLSELPYPYTLEMAIWWIKSMINAKKKNTDHVFAICKIDTDELIGVISLHGIHPTHKHANLGYWLGKKFWGHGYMTEAVALIIAFGFDELQLHRINSSVFTENIGSLKIMKRHKFKKEGLQRETSFRFGKWHNTVEFGLLNHEHIKKQSIT